MKGDVPMSQSCRHYHYHFLTNKETNAQRLGNSIKITESERENDPMYV